MNYRIEHHMVPIVPFYRLPEPREMIKAAGLWAAYKEIVPTLLRQRKAPSWSVTQQVAKAQPAMPVSGMAHAAG